jgi:hypothetical protein
MFSRRGYFRKVVATGSLFVGIDFSGRMDSAMELIPHRNRFFLFLYKNFFSDTLRKCDKAHVLDEKSISASKIDVSWAMGFSIHSHTRFLLGFDSAPSPPGLF